MRLKQWAEKNKVCYRTALRWFHKGLIPNAIQMVTGTVMVLDNKEEAAKFKEAEYEANKLV